MHMGIDVSLLEQPGYDAVCNIADRRGLGMRFKLHNTRFDAMVGVANQTPSPASRTQHPRLKMVMTAESSASWSLLWHLDSYEVVERTRFEVTGEVTNVLRPAEKDATANDPPSSL